MLSKREKIIVGVVIISFALIIGFRTVSLKNKIVFPNEFVVDQVSVGEFHKLDNGDTYFKVKRNSETDLQEKKIIKRSFGPVIRFVFNHDYRMDNELYHTIENEMKRRIKSSFDRIRNDSVPEIEFITEEELISTNDYKDLFGRADIVIQLLHINRAYDDRWGEVIEEVPVRRIYGGRGKGVVYSILTEGVADKSVCTYISSPGKGVSRFIDFCLQEALGIDN